MKRQTLYSLTFFFAQTPIAKPLTAKHFL